MNSKALDLAIAGLDKQLNKKGSVICLGDEDVVPWPSISTGAFTLDTALGIGGLPRGRVVEIYGENGTGKSTLALSVVAEAQKLGDVACYIDVEHALDPVYMKDLGIDIKTLLLAQPDTGEEALQIMDALIKTGELALIVVDSVSALVPRKELEGAMGESYVGLQARLMSQAMRKFSGPAQKTNTLLIFINQFREKIGMMYGDPRTTSGGRALQFYASVRIETQRKEILKAKEDGNSVGIRTKAKIVKNKLGPPYREAEFDILYGQGINKTGCIVDVAIKLDVVKKSGAWLTYGEDTVQGRDAFVELLDKENILIEKMKQDILEISK